MDDRTASAVEIEQTARKFAARHIAPLFARLDFNSEALPTEIFNLGRSAGFDRPALPESAGGLGFTATDLCLLVKTLAEVCAGSAIAFGAHAAAINAMFDAGAGADLLERIISAGAPLALALGETTDPQFDAPIKMVRNRPDEVTLSGAIPAAFNVTQKGLMIVFAIDEKNEPAAILVDLAKICSDGCASKSLGLRATPIAPVVFDNHIEPESSLIALGEKAVALNPIIKRRLCLVVGAAAAGLMESAKRDALAYAADRYQGGKMIIDHSHLRDIIGGMSAAVNSARGSLLYAAANYHDDLAVLGAKISVTEAAVKVCIDAVQLLGGYGYTREYGMEKKMRDAAVLALLPMPNLYAHQIMAAAEKQKL